MDTKDGNLLFKAKVFQIVGCAIEVLEGLGHGIVEKPCENALVVEFGVAPFVVDLSGKHVVELSRDRLTAANFQASGQNRPGPL